MTTELKGKHPAFRGNWEDLEHFTRLARSRIRSDEREVALAEWEEYKWSRQLAFARQQGWIRGALKKGPHLRVASAPAVDLRGATLDEICVGYVDLAGVRLDDASLRFAHLKGAVLRAASLRGANLASARLLLADLSGADLEGAILTGADLSGADFSGARLDNADLTGANLERSRLIGTKLRGTQLAGCGVYGVSAWDLEVCEDSARRRDLIVTPQDEPDITVDNLEVAQFIYLLLSNQKIRDVIDTITAKVVLILGRFAPERKVVLGKIREALRARNLLPLVCDFDKPANRDLTETVRTLAHLARFIVADLTDPRSVPHELQAIVPDLAVPVQSLVLKGSGGEYALFHDLRRRYHWVLPVFEYENTDELLSRIDERVIAAAEAKAKELAKARSTG